MNKNIIIGVTGGVAAYKAVMLVRLLQDAGCIVRVVMTGSAKEFVSPLTFQACTGHRVYSNLIDAETENSMAHIELGRWADLIIVAPATANFIAKCANGFADDLLSSLCLAATVPLVFAPAMNCHMWSHLATQKNLRVIKSRGVKIVDPESGELACGDIGVGRMADPAAIVDFINCMYRKKSTLHGRKVVITAGPTYESIDPIRYLGNRSSGKMGYAMAKAAVELGAEVVLISGPASLEIPDGVCGRKVESAQEMYQAVMQNIKDADIFIGAAAVANYRIENPICHKMKSTKDKIQLSLVKNPDIIAEVSRLSNKPFVVGFAAETENVLDAAKDKLQRKNLDMVIANHVGLHKGMGVDRNSATVLDKNGLQKVFPDMPKELLAQQLFDEIVAVVASHAQVGE